MSSSKSSTLTKVKVYNLEKLSIYTTYVLNLANNSNYYVKLLGIEYSKPVPNKKSTKFYRFKLDEISKKIFQREDIILSENQYNENWSLFEDSNSTSQIINSLAIQDKSLVLTRDLKHNSIYYMYRKYENRLDAISKCRYVKNKKFSGYVFKDLDTKLSFILTENELKSYWILFKE